MRISSRKFKPKKQTNTVDEPFVERTKDAQNKKGKKISGHKVETKGQKNWEDKQTTLEEKIHQNSAQDEVPAELGSKGNGTN